MAWNNDVDPVVRGARMRASADRIEDMADWVRDRAGDVEAERYYVRRSSAVRAKADEIDPAGASE